MQELDALATPLDLALLAKRVMPVVLLAIFWCWESWRPYFGHPHGRFRHAAVNLGLALSNSLVLGLLVGSATTFVADWSARHRHGLLNVLDLGWLATWMLAMALLDAWTYLWHRANHAIPFLWRFHRTHHVDRRMDVTTATRFHLGELLASAVLRLGLIPVLGLTIWHLVVYDSLLLAVTQFHHADVSIGRFDRWLRWLIVTPYFHKIHHSDWRPETNSNYGAVLSCWDRLCGTFRMRADPRTITFGLQEFDAPAWQTFWGAWKTPLANPSPNGLSDAASTRSPPHDNVDRNVGTTCRQ